MSKIPQAVIEDWVQNKKRIQDRLNRIKKRLKKYNKQLLHYEKRLKVINEHEKSRRATTGEQPKDSSVQS